MQNKADRTKQFIVEQTASVFNAKGFAGTSLSDLTAATGLSKGSIYGNFENKDAVALAAFDYTFAKVVAFLKAKMDVKTSSIEKLLVYPETYRNFLSIPFLKEGCPVLNTSVDADDTHPQLKQRVNKALQLWKKSIENQVNAGIENKQIKPNTDAASFAIVLMSLIEGAVMQSKVSGKSTELMVTMNFLENIIRELAL